MTFRAIYRDGVVILPESADIPDGSRLDVRVVREARPRPNRTRTTAKKPAKASKKRKSSLNDALRVVIGKAKGLPRDASRNIDHYLYGAPKR